MDRGSLGVLESMRECFRRDGRAAEPGIVLWNRAVAADPEDAPGKVAADIRIVREVVIDAIQVGVVEPETIGPGDKQRPVAADDNAALRALSEDVDVLQPPIIRTQPRPGDPLCAELHRPALGEWSGPDALVEVLDRPRRRRLAPWRRKVGEVEEPVSREVGVQHDIVQALGGH